MELGKHNKLIQKAMEKEERLLTKVNRIEQQMMEKEVNNYEDTQKKRRDFFAASAEAQNIEIGKYIFSCKF